MNFNAVSPAVFDTRSGLAVGLNEHFDFISRQDMRHLPTHGVRDGGRADQRPAGHL